MSTTFRLTMFEAPPERGGYEWSRDGATWHACGTARVRQLLETHYAYPDEDRIEIDRGATVAGDRNGAMFVRRRLSAVEADARSRQLGLGL